MSQSVFRIIGQDLMINGFQKIFGLILNSILSMFFLLYQRNFYENPRELITNLK